MGISVPRKLLDALAEGGRRLVVAPRLEVLETLGEVPLGRGEFLPGLLQGLGVLPASSPAATRRAAMRRMGLRSVMIMILISQAA